MRALLLSSVFLSLLASPAWADDAWGDGVEVMGAKELDTHRGGFAIGNLNVNFGATVTTLVNGVPAMVTTLTWTDVGAFVEQTVGNIGQDIASMTPEQITALGLNGLSNPGGVIIDDEAGVTALVHNVTEGSIQNIIINSATGRDLAQQVDVTLTLPGFALVQSALVSELFGIHLADDLRGPGG